LEKEETMLQGTRNWSCVVVGLLVAQAVATQTVLAQAQALQGEVVDPAIYLKEGRRGLEAEDETYEAVNGGQTLCLLEEGTGTLYLFLAEEPGEDPNELVYDYVNQQVKVTGTLYERGGVRGIVATSVEPVEALGSPAASLEAVVEE
jgi:hypothetical protein